MLRLLGPTFSLGRNSSDRGRFFDGAAVESLTSDEHEVRRKLRVVEPLGIAVRDPLPTLRIDERSESFAVRELARTGVFEGAPLIGVHAGAFLPTRRWRLNGFADVIRELTAGGTPLLLTGGNPDKERCRALAENSGGPDIVAIDEPLALVAALIRRCRLFITNDTSVMHIAAALNVPTVALFGVTNVARYRPLLPSERCEVLAAPRGLCPIMSRPGAPPECRCLRCPLPDRGRQPWQSPCRCLDAISTAGVVAAARRLLERTEPQ
jgi:ADP-heptose:LPS heptosyltransferase